MNAVWRVGWRALVVVGASALYAWACLEYTLRRTYGRGLVDQGLTEKQLSSVVETMTRPTEYVFWVATGLYLLLWVTVVASWVSRRTAEGSRS